jgi:predicted DNA-binding transcriptional regulator AlpA
MAQEVDLLTTKQLAAYLKKPVGTIHAWRRRRVGPPGFRLGRDVVYRHSAVDAWLERLETAGQEPS